MPTVTVSQGTLKGGISKTDNGFTYCEFLGIPYAKPPVGDLRFKCPEPPESWDYERDATTVSADHLACQIDFNNGKISGSEDCLYLNVFTPKLPESHLEPLPVMVYIHGGGFIYGNGIMKHEVGPDFLIENNVIVVTINYRLGVFGFLSLDIPEAAGNMGLKDQVKALEWVQGNIDKFGGDKDNVTIFGISAGSAAIDYLTLSPLAKGLFHKTILQSGSCLNDWAINFEPKSLVLKLLKQLGYKGPTDNDRTIYEFLISIPAPVLTGAAFQVSEIFTSKAVYFGFVPVIEKDFGNAFLKENPYKLMTDGKFSQVPTIRGFCDNEGSLMSMMKPDAVKYLMDKKTFVSYWAYEFDSLDNDRVNTKVLETYLENIKPDDENDKFAVEFFGDLHFVAGVWIAAKLLSSKGVPVRVYKFSYDGKLNFCKKIFGLMKKGAAHGDDLTYIFRHEAMATKMPDEADKLVRSRITKMWTNFAKTSEPTPENSSDMPIVWPIFTEGSPLYLNIDKDFTIEADYEPAKMEIFEEIYGKYNK